MIVLWNNLKHIVHVLLIMRATHQVLVSDDDKKRREKRQRIVHTNVATALLAILKSIRPYAESEYNVDVPWVSR